MSFCAYVTHEGVITFREADPIDYDLLQQTAGSEAVSKLQDLLKSRLPIEHPDLVRRCKNSKRYHYESKGQAVASGILHGLAKGASYGLSELAFKKSFPRLKDKHMQPIKKMLLSAIIQCGLTPQTVVVLDSYEGQNDLTGSPDLVPEYQFWSLFLKAQNATVNFTRLQEVLHLKHEEKIQRCLAEGAKIDATGNSGSIGLVKTIQAQKRLKRHSLSAEMLLEKRLSLLSLPDTLSSTTQSAIEQDVVVPPPLPSAAVTSVAAGQATAHLQTDPLVFQHAAPELPVIPPKPLVPTGSPLERKQRKDTLAEHRTMVKTFILKLKCLVAALKKEHAATVQQRVARAEVTAEVLKWSINTPLLDKSAAFALTNVNQEDDKLGKSFEGQYETSVLSCAVQWEAAVTQELNSNLMGAKDSITGLEHYEKKVDNLRESAKGKYDNAAIVHAEKIARNEEKLVEAIRINEEAQQKLLRSSQVIESSWMVVYPLLERLFSCDMHTTSERANIKRQLYIVLNGMSQAVTSNGLPLNTDIQWSPAEVWNHLTLHGPSNLTLQSSASVLVAAQAQQTIPPAATTPAHKPTNNNTDDYEEIHKAAVDLAEDFVEEAMSDSSSDCEYEYDHPSLIGTDIHDYAPEPETSVCDESEEDVSFLTPVYEDPMAEVAVGPGGDPPGCENMAYEADFAQGGDPPGECDPPGGYGDEEDEYYEDDDSENATEDQGEEYIGDYDDGASCEDQEEPRDDENATEDEKEEYNACNDDGASCEDQEESPENQYGDETVQGYVPVSAPAVEDFDVAHSQPEFSPGYCEPNAEADWCAFEQQHQPQFDPGAGDFSPALETTDFSAGCEVPDFSPGFEAADLGDISAEAAVGAVGGAGNFLLGLFE